jgi:hypothetical protein
VQNKAGRGLLAGKGAEGTPSPETGQIGAPAPAEVKPACSASPQLFYKPLLVRPVILHGSVGDFILVKIEDEAMRITVLTEIRIALFDHQEIGDEPFHHRRLIAGELNLTGFVFITTAVSNGKHFFNLPLLH